ncbi:MAG: 16S rRNA (guanine(527)-N(7))-methyltransferase RsmG, partial [Chloroflexota bacterium]
LTEANRQVNLTAITGYVEVQTKHFLDSLTCLLALPSEMAAPDAPTGLADVGTGAGFPGVPLKLVRPRFQLTLIESIRKKTDFLHRLVAELGLEDVTILTARAEEVGRDPAHRERFDAVVARAVARLDVLAEYCLPLCRVGGVFIALKKAPVSEELALAAEPMALLGGRAARVVEPDLTPYLTGRVLVVVEKIRPTPERYPRRAGMPAKRPLSGHAVPVTVTSTAETAGVSD